MGRKKDSGEKEIVVGGTPADEELPSEMEISYGGALPIDNPVNIVSIKFGGGAELMLHSSTDIDELVGHAKDLISTPSFKSALKTIFGSNGTYKWGEVNDAE